MLNINFFMFHLHFTGLIINMMHFWEASEFFIRNFWLWSKQDLQIAFEDTSILVILNGIEGQSLLRWLCLKSVTMENTYTSPSASETHSH